MTNPNPFDFSDFGPPQRQGPPSAPPGLAGPPAQAGFDPWAGQPPAQAPQPSGPQDIFGAAPTPHGQDVFGQSTATLGGTALKTAGPPLVWFGVALGLAVLGAVIAIVGAVAGPWLLTALAGWLLAGPVAIGALAVYTRVDTRRRTEAIYSAPGWTETLYWVVLAACLIGIAIGAWQIALWAGRF
ncbi:MULTISPECIES: hypothetical protein [unclassified Mycobacterium]|uniref:hypothetical protein n=1 Tax=Mycobacterium sp. DL99 TaxID=2528957 RepID=UPI001081E20B|nr:hypothetical protein [Mycobacterium sp. DL99]